ncbi:MAG TPA: ornithine acetyltransferase [Elusimicrobia bacterium]|nr:MAG: bifunctional ornithine acetyltransferase/N-acetylglutamate synthase [Elusimicrobia bacterium RIFOXYA12_FULL_49_49]OGS14963.1 MAG: bifunctional ornithine acetyltransferase/N-acetylglutamate synthase [Elusimicrobia bacterium RIFOXYA2_FULL_47_53]OGS26102.1 MAG: bifunctional ornithine acetyltransferase/N-acetylglutamate synthase [Elusimicrobia bacterium RIFOXYB12_FULL_50_12]OGS29308.1 MAG: bifunctional ornithine acetyltransferase/N-acetylglutamate synthase [Elusimicrobia bacterium RIFOXYB2_F
MFPKGFKTAGARGGISKKKDKKDTALFYSEFPCAAAGMFTNNLVKAAPVLVSTEHLKKSASDIRAVIANSGCANACTGERGLADARETCSYAAKKLALNQNQVLVASTGVIGQFLPMKAVKSGIDILLGSAGSGPENFDSASRAIMTTDLIPKVSSAQVKISGKTVSIWGCVKGSGMIHPDMSLPHATMLAFILTDAAIDKKTLASALSAAVENSFNCVSVDGDTSTNDSVFALANGASLCSKIKPGGRDFVLFSQALGKVCLELAKLIALDGEGATRLVEIRVMGAGSRADAKKIASTIATSPLVKTAIFGNDANWGRILAAAGRAGVAINPSKVDIRIGGLKVASKGMALNFSEAAAKKILTQKEILITLDLNMGSSFCSYYTCDLSFDYIKINASYRS